MKSRIPSRKSRESLGGRCDDYKNPESLDSAVPRVISPWFAPWPIPRRNSNGSRKRPRPCPTVFYPERRMKKPRGSSPATGYRVLPFRRVSQHVCAIKWGTPVVASIIDPDGILRLTGWDPGGNRYSGDGASRGTPAAGSAGMVGVQRQRPFYAKAHHDIRKIPPVRDIESGDWAADL